MVNTYVTNDIGPIGARSIVNALIIMAVLGVIFAIVWRQFKNTFTSFYVPEGQCPPDNFYHYKDASIHPGCK
jgi:hypothetical protein